MPSSPAVTLSAAAVVAGLLRQVRGTCRTGACGRSAASVPRTRTRAGPPSGRGDGFEIVDAAGHDGAQMLGEVPSGPVPPRQGEKPGDVRLAVAGADEPGRVAVGDAAVRHVVATTAPQATIAPWPMQIPGMTMAR